MLQYPSVEHIHNFIELPVLVYILGLGNSMILLSEWLTIMIVIVQFTIMILYNGYTKTYTCQAL